MNASLQQKGGIEKMGQRSCGPRPRINAIASWTQTEAVPEPTTIAGSLLALGGLVAARRNRQSKSKDKLAA